MSISPTGQVSLTSPGTAINQISTIARQLTTGSVSLSQEGALEQQLVTAISKANPSANWANIATIADDLANVPSTTQINIDTQALDRMVQPTTGQSGLTTTVDGIAQQIFSQVQTLNVTANGPTQIDTTLAGQGLVGATSLTVKNMTGMNIGDNVQVSLDDGSVFDTTITSTSSTTMTRADDGVTITVNTVDLAGALPIAAASGALFIDNGGTQSSDIINYTPGLVAPAVAGDTTLSLSSVSGLNISDAIQVQLDNGTWFNTSITAISTGSNTVTLGEGLPSAASVGNVLTDQVNLAQPTGTTSPNDEVSAAMVSVLLLQMSNLVNAANPAVNQSTMAKIEQDLGSPKTTEATYQKDLQTLNQIAVEGLTSGTTISVLA